MAIKNSSGVFVEEEKPQSINKSSVDQGFGTPETPKGSTTAGANPDQAAQVGTPAQQSVAAKVPTPAPTLEDTKRYSPKASEATEAQEQAKEAAQSLSTLGPVRTAVKGLITSRMNTLYGDDEAGVEGVMADLGVDQDQLDLIEDEDQRTAATDALNAYIAEVRNPESTETTREAAAQVFYDSLDEGASASLGTGGISKYLQGTPEAIAAAAQGALDGVVNMGTLVAEGNVDMDLEGIAAALGPDVTAADVAAMTLDELDGAIDALEAAEFSQVDQIRAQLSSATLTPQQREQLLKQLAQLSSSGMTGTEASIDKIDEMIAQGQTVEIGGIPMSLEKALSDEGISETIRKAITDPDFLEDLKDIPGMEGLATWIDVNKDSLYELVGDLKTETDDFVTTQDKVETVKASLGEGNEALIAEIFKDLGLDLGGTMMSGDLAKLEAAMIADDPMGNLFQFFKDDKKWKGLALDDPELMKSITLMAKAGFKKDDLEEVLNAYEQMDEAGNEALKILFGSDEYPASPEEWAKTQADIDEYESMDEIVRDGTLQWVQNGKLDFEDLQAINNSDDPQAILDDLTALEAEKAEWKRFKDNADTPRQAALEYLFGKGNYNFNIQDLRYAYASADENTKARLKSIFDTDGDGKISKDEFKDDAGITGRIGHQSGAGGDFDSVIKSDGDWESGSRLLETGEGADARPVLAAGGFRGAFTNEASQHYIDKAERLVPKLDQLEQDIQAEVGKMGFGDLDVNEIKKVGKRYKGILNYRNGAGKIIAGLSGQALQDYPGVPPYSGPPFNKSTPEGKRKNAAHLDNWEKIQRRKLKAKNDQRYKDDVEALSAKHGNADVTKINDRMFDNFNKLTKRQSELQAQANKFDKAAKDVSKMSDADLYALYEELGI